MAVNLAKWIGTGLSPQQFIDGMTRNQEAFLDWHRRFEWSSEQQKAQFLQLAEQSPKLRCVIFAADWCGDVVRNVPVVFHAMDAASVPTEVLILEEHLDLVDEHFLTMGGRSIPVVLIVDSDGDVVGQWGPRPRYVQEVMEAFKQNHPDRTASDYDDNLKQTRAEMMRRYGEGTEYQDLIISELAALFEQLVPTR